MGVTCLHIGSLWFYKKGRILSLVRLIGLESSEAYYKQPRGYMWGYDVQMEEDVDYMDTP